MESKYIVREYSPNQLGKTEFIQEDLHKLSLEGYRVISHTTVASQHPNGIDYLVHTFVLERIDH